MDIGNEIKKQRIYLDMTQKDLAERLNVTRTAVSNWERGRNYPDINTLLSISNVLNISIEALLKEDVKMVENVDNSIKVGKYWKNWYRSLFFMNLPVVIDIIKKITNPEKTSTLNYEHFYFVVMFLFLITPIWYWLLGKLKKTLPDYLQ
ncbi:MAG: helix-turn-helix transcriptional regulator [Vagococcus sp.]|uniref:helix-turn-helix domain-containing protein n=1 Tax=Vagococcus TaxID=2737 RepID=UPI002FC58F56